MSSHLESRPVALLERAHLSAACLSALVLCTSFGPLKQWLLFSKTSVQSSDLWLIPLISLFLLFSRRKEIFEPEQTRPAYWAIPIIVIGVLIAIRTQAGVEQIPALSSLGLFVALISCFVTCYGLRITRRSRFPLLFALLAVPIPETALNAIVTGLQHGSAVVVQSLFWLLRIDFVRDGMRFDFPAFAIEIASECSGIRSSFALLVLTILLAEMMLRTRSRRLLLVAAVVPLVLIKNGIRIVTLTILAMKVDQSFLDGKLHHRGGFVFFGVALMIEGVLCWGLVRSERKLTTAQVPLTRETAVGSSS